jgi:hypothetical protein
MARGGRATYVEDALAGVVVLDLELQEVDGVRVGAQRAQEACGGGGGGGASGSFSRGYAAQTYGPTNSFVMCNIPPWGTVRAKRALVRDEGAWLRVGCRTHLPRAP